MKQETMKQVYSLCLLIAISLTASSQINPSPSQYFYNRIFQNVAASGMNKGVQLNAVYRNMTPNSFMGSPVNTMISLQGSTNTRSGMGLQFQNERAGLLSRTRVMGSYALNLRDDDTKIRLGVGVGAMMTRLNPNGQVMLRGEQNDPVIGMYNNQKARIDGSIGFLVSTKKGWEVMASLPSMGTIQEFRGYNAIDYMVANAMVSKKISMSKDDAGVVEIQPMIGYRIMQGVPDVFDAGVLLNYKGWIRFMGIYHSNNEFAAGVGIPFKDKLSVDFTYNTGKVYNKAYLNVGGTLEAHLMYKF